MSSAPERTAFSILQASSTLSLVNQVADAILLIPGPDDTIDDLPKILWRTKLAAASSSKATYTKRRAEAAVPGLRSMDGS